jgi:hypothetical protein
LVVAVDHRAPLQVLVDGLLDAVHFAGVVLDTAAMEPGRNNLNSIT